MSSVYRIICMSHDPAILLTEDEYHSGVGGREALAARLENLDIRPVTGHETCKLIGGRYSYPLIEVYDPAGRRDRDTGATYPGQWIDAAWLALALAAYTQLGADSPPAIVKALAGLHDWPAERLSRLTGELAHYLPEPARAGQP